MGLSHDGLMILEGKLKGLEGYAVGRMTKSHRGKLYIDDEGWDPEAGSIEYGYRVPFGGIHVFIGKIGEPALSRTFAPTSSRRLSMHDPLELSPP